MITKIKLIVDTNRLIAALIKDGASRKILYELDADFLTINFGYKELKKYEKYILKKTKLTKFELDAILKNIKLKLIPVQEDLVKLRIGEANKILGKIDKADVPFIAAALATGANIWSDDKHFKKQRKIKICTTSQLIKLLK